MLAGQVTRCGQHLKRMQASVRVCTNLLQFPKKQYQERSMSTSRHKLDIGGIYPPIPTPFDREENIYWDKLRDNMRLWNRIHFRGYVVQGSNGEYIFLSPEERVEMVSQVRSMAPKDKLIMAGSGCESTRDTIIMSEKMAEAGADVLLVVTPSYFKSRMTSAAMINHFTRVADASPVPVVLYNVPANTSVDLAPEVVIALASHPNIIGLKESGGDIAKIGNMVYRTQDEDFQILAGSASFLYPALTVGCVGGVCALANMLGEELVQLGHLFHKGQLQEAKYLQQRLIAPNAAVTKIFGVPAVKASLEWFGFYGGPVRGPLQPLTETELEAVREAFTTNGFLKDD